MQLKTKARKQPALNTTHLQKLFGTRPLFRIFDEALWHKVAKRWTPSVRVTKWRRRFSWNHEYCLWLAQCTHITIYSLCFNGHYSTWTWVSWYQNVSILGLFGAKRNGDGGDNWSYKMCKLQSNHHHQQTNTQLYKGILLIIIHAEHVVHSAWILFWLCMYVCMFVCMLAL